MRRSPTILASIAAALMLSGCVAAAIPVVAGGAIARSAKRQQPKPPQGVAATPQVTPARAAPIPNPPPLPTPLPSDPAKMRAGQFYAGSLPTPAPAASALPAAPSRPKASDWSDIGHHIAANLSPEHGVLLARGSDAIAPRWVGCSGKPAALLAAAATAIGRGAIDPSARSWLEALQVMNVRPVLVAADKAEASAAKIAFTKAALPSLIDGDTLIVATSGGELPAIRADVAARYCVVALVGRSSADFPNGLTPATTPPALGNLWGHGWFLVSTSP